MSNVVPLTGDRIAEGALRLLARRGVREVSMTEVCQEAGVSRGTLYRYFGSREEVLAAAEGRVEQTLADALEAAVAARPDPGSRLEVVLTALHRYVSDRPALLLILEREPRIALDYLARRLPVLVGLLARALEPVLHEAPAVRQQLLGEDQLAEIVLRTVLARRVLPGSASPQTDEQELLVLAGLLGVPVHRAEQLSKAG
jgi:AcrR family transcriptional regulator